MSENDREERIRVRAHQIWERNGRPEGQHDAHWEQARREVEAEASGADALEKTVTETIGLAVGVEPTRRKPAAKPKAPARPKKV